MDEQGTLYFITGPASERKEAAGRALADRLRERRAGAALYLDDALLWPMFEIPLDTEESRRVLAMEHELPLCRLMTGQGIDVALCSVIMSGDARAWAVEHIPQFREIAFSEADGGTPEEWVRSVERRLFPGGEGDAP